MGKGVEWLKYILYDIELWSQSMTTILIFCDSKSTISRAYNNVYNEKSRHISLRHELMRQLIGDGISTITYVKSKGNLLDPLTKGVVTSYEGKKREDIKGRGRVKEERGLEGSSHYCSQV